MDAAIVDLHLPQSTGLRLLNDLVAKSPETLRIGLTTMSDRHSIDQVDVPAHQVLAKACDVKVLRALLARAFASQDFTSDHQVTALVEGITSLPVLPQTYSEIVKELESDDPSLERAGAIVAQDMGLTTKVLQLVNSAFFGLGRSIAHPAEAAMFLGTETLKSLVLSVQVFSQFEKLTISDFKVESLWQHSWNTGVLARRVCEAEEAERSCIDEAFIAGLLHDVGKLLLAANHPQRLEQSIRKARESNISLWEQEFLEYGASHAELGGYLLGRWGLPTGVIQAVAFHHRPAHARRQSFGPLTAVHVANTLGKTQSNGSNLAHQALDLDYLRGLGLRDRVDGWTELFK
jgi:HD-like signal output (HDOD) protein